MSCRLVAAAVAVLAFTACNSARTLDSKGSAATCTRCHGDPARTDGAPAGGAHAGHLAAKSGIAAPVACEACHAVPASTSGHPDGRVDVVFGAVARPGGAPATWDRGSSTCSVYCHGATPVAWARVQGTKVACGSCHGDPPVRPHPQRSDCQGCHPATVDAEGRIRLAGGRHVDGAVQVELSGCTDCHGDASRPGEHPLPAAPPSGSSGERETADRAVGAHAAHLVAGNVAGPVRCAECHEVPTALDHADGRADVAFGPAASRGTARPAWDAGAASCAGTYCHGATLAGGEAKAPSWTRVDGTQRRCDSCHGAPPPAPHAASAPCAGDVCASCSACHPGTVASSGRLVASGLHLDGNVDTDVHAAGWGTSDRHGRAANRALAGCKECHGADLTGGSSRVSCDGCHAPGWRSSCTFCHGEPNRAAGEAAPPRGTEGETSRSQPAVGAHLAHVQDGTVRRALSCEECHEIPTDLSHVDGAAKVAFGVGALASAKGVAPRYAGGACSSTYCHGATLAGGEAKTPSWTQADGSERRCDGCHGAPPPGAHPQLAACEACHGETVLSATTIDVAGGKHLDGEVQVSSSHEPGWSDRASPNFHARSAKAGLASCQFCHGDDLAGGWTRVSCGSCHSPGDEAAWKTDCTECHGGTSNATGAPPRATWGNAAPQAIGAHASHVTATHGLAAPLDCAACHVKPADALQAEHLDGSARVTGYTGADAALLAAVEDPGYARSGAGASCATAYCHGATLQGGLNTRPSWTTIDGTQRRCDSCHGRPPSTGPIVPAFSGNSAHRYHTVRQNLECNVCHDGYSSASGSVDQARHVNGVRDVRVKHCAEIGPPGCDPETDCVCVQERVSNVVGWDCGGCHSKFTF